MGSTFVCLFRKGRRGVICASGFRLPAGISTRTVGLSYLRLTRVVPVCVCRPGERKNGHARAGPKTSRTVMGSIPRWQLGSPSWQEEYGWKRERAGLRLALSGDVRRRGFARDRLYAPLILQMPRTSSCAYTPPRTLLRTRPPWMSSLDEAHTPCAVSAPPRPASIRKNPAPHNARVCSAPSRTHDRVSRPQEARAHPPSPPARARERLRHHHNHNASTAARCFSGLALASAGCHRATAHCGRQLQASRTGPRQRTCGPRTQQPLPLPNTGPRGAPLFGSGGRRARLPLRAARPPLSPPLPSFCQHPPPTHGPRGAQARACTRTGAASREPPEDLGTACYARGCGEMSEGNLG